MKFLFVPFFIILSLCFMLSCSDELPNNHEQPIMGNIHFNTNDTIQFLKPSEVNSNELVTEVIHLNQFSDRMLDTLLIGKDVRLFGNFSSSNGLSNIKVRIFGDTLLISDTDTCYNKIKVPNLVDFYGLNNAELDSVKIFDAIGAYEVDLNGVRKEVRTGNEYKYTVMCGDRVGNVDSLTYTNKPIVILNRDQVLIARGYK